MTAAVGSHIGPYEVIAPVGAGGMGEVWRARDPRIGREVAIKVLPREFAESSDRLHRFEQEARAAGSLSHPNLVTIHELGTHDGAPFIAMEMLEGATLREKLRGGHGSSASASGVGTPLPVRKAVEIAMQVATGLAAAHDKGLVHRDLKPENIFVTSDGIAKVLDFGLVKLSSNFGGDFEEQATVPRSSPGVALGTAGYMSPEQVSGGTIDGRSDIFSLGAVLYELLSGRRAFHGPTAVETMNAILHEDPPALSGETSRVPPTLDRIVRRCLEKEPRQRFQSARDVVFALEAMGDASTGSGERVEARGKAVRGRLWRTIALICALGIAAAGGAFIARHLAKGEREVPRYRQLTFREGNLLRARFSSDGQTIYYAASWDGRPAEVFAVGRDGSNSRELGLVNYDLLAVSRTNELAVLRRTADVRAPVQAGVLARLPATGGTPRDVADQVLAADWFPDGQSLAALRLVDGKFLLEAPLGTVIWQPALSGPSICRVSPDGKFVATLELRSEGIQVVIVDLRGEVVRRSRSFLSANVQGLAWSPDGREVFAAVNGTTGATIASLPLDGAERSVLSAPGKLALHDVAEDGAVMLEQWSSRSVTRVLRPGSDEGATNVSWLGRTAAVDITPRGDLMLFADRNPSTTWDIGMYIARFDGRAPVFLGDYFPGGIVPDGSGALASSFEGELVLVPLGAGATRSLGRIDLADVIPGFPVTPDGRFAYLLGTPGGAKRGLYKVQLDGGGLVPVAVPGPPSANPLSISPDGTMIGAAGGDGSPAIVELASPGTLRPLPGCSPDERIVGWSSDSKAALIATTGNEPEIHRIDLESGARTFVYRVSLPDRAELSTITVTRVTPDAKVVLCGGFHATNSDLWIAEGIR